MSDGRLYSEGDIMRALWLIPAFGLASCAGFGVPRVEGFKTPDGRDAFFIRCGGELLTLASCHNEARKVCGGDYTEVNRTVTPRGETSTENRSIEVVCKA